MLCAARAELVPAAISVTELTDIETIRRIMTHPRIYPKIRDDMSPTVEEFQPIISEGLHYVGIQRNGIEGLIFYHRHNAVTYEAHTCLTPPLWGGDGRRGWLLTAQWMFANTDCRKIVGMCPADNPLIERFAMDIGFSVEGVNRKSLLRGGELLDQTVVGLTKEEFECRQQQ